MKKKRIYDQIQEKVIEILKISMQYDDPKMGLLGGRAGIVLLQLTYFDLDHDNLYEKIGIENIERIFDQIAADTKLESTFCNGIAGIGWLLQYLERQKLIDVNCDEMLATVDTFLIKKLRIQITENNWDFLHGAIGLGMYFLSRNKSHPIVRKALRILLGLLEQTAELSLNSCYKWRSILNIETGEQGYNISMAHGQSSIIVFLVKMYKENINKRRVKKLLNYCVNYLISQEINKDRYGSFFTSYAIESQKDIRKSRLAWCYGDLGIAMALWQAGNCLNNEFWRKKALEILLYAADRRRNIEENSVFDAGLCHGSVGIAHIFYRIWWNTKITEFKEAAEYWFEVSLKMAKFPNGLAGYKTFQPPTLENWQNDFGLLTGIAGIGLAFLTYSKGVEPTWDECLMLS